MSEEVISDDKKPVDSVDERDGVVKYETYQRVLAQRKADQEKIRALEESDKKLKELEAEAARLTEEKLKSEGNWKALLESREAKVKEIEEKLLSSEKERSQYVQQFVEASKLQAFQDALGGKLKHKEYYNLVDTDQIAVDPETGKIDKDSLKKYADSFLKEHKDLIAFTKQPVDSRAPQNPSTAITYDQWLELARKNPKEANKRKKDVKL